MNPVICTTYVTLLLLFQGGGQVELVPHGSEVEVTPQNVYEYVRLYAEYRMVKVAEKALEVSALNCTAILLKTNMQTI